MMENCSKIVNSLENTLKAKNETIRGLENRVAKLEEKVERLSSDLTISNSYSEIFRNMFFLTLAFLVGTFFAILRR